MGASSRQRVAGRAGEDAAVGAEEEQEIQPGLPAGVDPLTPQNVPYFTVRGEDFPNPELARQIMEQYGEDRGDGPLRLAIIGQPNAGKSSLLNALAGAELAIVTPIAGTTRDKVQETIQINGVPLHVIDTAGLRESSDEVERIGIARAWEEIAQADAVLFLHDLTRSNAPEYQAADADIATVLAQKLPKSVPVLHIWNKEDIANTATAVPAATDGLRLSAKHGQGLDALRQRLLEIAGWQSAPEGLYIARARHVQALQATGEHLAQAHALLQTADPALDLLAEELRLAQHHLGAITGEFTSDDLLGVIFSSFCIGK